MRTNLSPTDWRVARLHNYRTKLRLSQKKALKRLMLFAHIPDLIREFDRIVDAPYRSNNEPGISHEQRKRRVEAIYKKPPPPKAIQLKLFS